MQVPDQLVKTIELGAKVAQIIAYGAGAFWVLWNYVLNRTHVPRLDVAIDASVQQREDRCYLLASLAITNPSSRIARIRLDDSLLLISRLRILDEVVELKDPEWHSPALVHALKWKISGRPEKPNQILEIEPGLTLAHQQLILLPQLVKGTILLLMLWMPGAKKHWWNREPRVWRTTTVVTVGTS